MQTFLVEIGGDSGSRTHEAVAGLTLSKRVQLTTMRHFQNQELGILYHIFDQNKRQTQVWRSTWVRQVAAQARRRAAIDGIISHFCAILTTNWGKIVVIGDFVW